jgi:hypothetical protein
MGSRVVDLVIFVLLMGQWHARERTTYAWAYYISSRCHWPVAQHHWCQWEPFALSVILRRLMKINVSLVMRKYYC